MIIYVIASELGLVLTIAQQLIAGIETPMSRKVQCWPLHDENHGHHRLRTSKLHMAPDINSQYISMSKITVTLEAACTARGNLRPVAKNPMEGISVTFLPLPASESTLINNSLGDRS